MTERGSARRRLAGRTATAVAIVCALAGCGVLAYAAYELWGTGGAERAVQAELEATFDADDASPPTMATTATEADPATEPAAAGDPPADDELLPGDLHPAVAARRFPADGAALARLEIPAIEVDKFVMRDVDVASLQVGPGHYASSPRPGFDGNAAIAGHRTTYGAPFGRVDELAAGDEITVQSADGIFTYVVLDPADAFGDRLDDVNAVDGGHVIVDPDDTWVVADFGDARLTLTSCHPEFTSRDRIVVVAELVSEGVPYGDFFAGLDEADLVELVAEDLSTLGQG